MQHNYNHITPIEKIISILSYVTMGIAGVIWIIIAYVLKKKLTYFLMYNVAQSMLISILYAIFVILLGIIVKITYFIPFLIVIGTVINDFLSKKIVTLLWMSFSVSQLLVAILLAYIIIGVIVGRIFYVPVLSNLMNKAMKSYN